MIKDSDLYAEVYEILSNLDNEIIMRIPEELMDYLAENRNTNYISRIDKEDLFNVNNIDSRTAELITWININYLADEAEKLRLIEICKNNKEQMELNDIVKNENPIVQEVNEVHDFDDDDFSHRSDMIPKLEYEHVFDKIKNFFKKIFSK